MTKPRVEKLRTLKTIAETLNQGHDVKATLNEVLKELLSLTNLQSGWIFLIEEDGSYTLAADAYLPPALSRREKVLMCEGECYCLTKFNNGGLRKAANIMNCKRIESAEELHCFDTEGITHHATVPLEDGDRRFGLLNVAAAGKTLFDEEELHLLEAVAFQIGTALQRMRLAEYKQKNALLMERNRLAQELHDSVNQMLFSVSLTAKAAKTLTQEETLQQMIDFIQTLTQDALAEMKSLIWQLRPGGLEKGLAEAIKSYGTLIGLNVVFTQKGCPDLRDEEEHMLWRVVQEALNNCKKHAGTDTAYVRITASSSYAALDIIDHGAGFRYEAHDGLPSLGIKGMKERAEKAGAEFFIESELGAGTKLSVRLPLTNQKGRTVR
ncbi:GAF domain-containing sensor histidine kinase [Bacillus halotolerans]|uniref:GAF domain-containing sensor histidine kinase n=1 Tax=Bacillus halotolerans TaxID=260554 RepID=UPI000750EDF2|nr:GAF domain-containing sensor histidine kinase [Bacillus halotolerans]KUP31374.1 histidine kinase [Bacillus halotolerans]MBL4964250.1 GAF domain-containing sensor histidine kinase [Bacillus halotolerans]MBL4975745.1 GAF domain-containing sensor histidine kinase [Bacillus halotolerans]MEC1543365.1 GAF domain-containing sensor histidine kinase [Bacillus halotolerans]PHI48569.1 histidine kinase [Bacillus halotolerans]